MTSAWRSGRCRRASSSCARSEPAIARSSGEVGVGVLRANPRPGGHLQAGAASGDAERIDRPVVDDPHRPGLEPAELRPIIGAAPPDREETVLDRLFGAAGVAADVAGDTQRVVGVAAVELGEGEDVVALGADHQRLVGHLARFSGHVLNNAARAGTDACGSGFDLIARAPSGDRGPTLCDGCTDPSSTAGS